MKKRTVYMICLAIALALLLAGCGGEAAPNPTDIEKPEISAPEVQKPAEKQEKEPEAKEEPIAWGVEDQFITDNGNEAKVFISLPVYLPLIKGGGKIAYQDDDTLVLFAGEKEYSEATATAPDNVFPAFFEDVSTIIDGYRGSRYDNFDFVIDEKENVAINDYEMCKYIGKHTFTFKGETQKMQFVAYATQVKSNGAWFYWMVLDESEEQNLGDLISEHALNMAKSVHE